MISISKLYSGAQTQSDGLRYGRASGESNTGQPVPKSAFDRRPVVVWNITRTCNLRCIHCYTDSYAESYPDELTTEEAKRVIQDLASFGIPALLFSGGEPLVRKDLFELVAYAKSLGIRPTLSTNGVLITEDIARRIKNVGFTYVGISLDGVGILNDSFRGVEGAYERAMQGFRNCINESQRVGLRLTLTRHNYSDLNNIFDFIEHEGIHRACFYHLVYAGRGQRIADEDLTHQESRQAMDTILERTEDFHKRGLDKEILTVDNHVDGIYLYMKLMERDDPRAEDVYRLLKWNGGGMYSSGVGLGDIDFKGDVHPDQFWMHYTIDNVRNRPFSQIWMDTSDRLMAGLKNRREHIKGRCSRCKWFDLCGGAMRVRADFVYNDPFAPDPACYIADDEIGLTSTDKVELKERGEGFFSPTPAKASDKILEMVA